MRERVMSFNMTNACAVISTMRCVSPIAGGMIEADLTPTQLRLLVRQVIDLARALRRPGNCLSGYPGAVTCGGRSSRRPGVPPPG